MIPHKVLEQVKEVEGNYSGPLRIETNDGKINRPFQEKITVKLSLQGRELELETKADIAGIGCGSRVGRLKKLVMYGNKEKRVIQGYFAFDPNRCQSKIRNDQLLFISRPSTEGRDSLELFLIKDYVNTLPGAGKSPLNIRGHLSSKNG